MPINSEGEEVEYTTDVEIKYLLEAEDIDYCVEFTGYLAEVLGQSTVGKDKQYDLFKAIITNGSKRITLLIWETDIVKKLFNDLIPGKIFYLDGVQGQVVQQRKIHRDMNLLNYELIIQKKTIVQVKGSHVSHLQNQALTPITPTVEFIDIAKAKGEILVKAYIKTVVAAASTKSGTMSFGSGSITDGTHKLPLQVASFKANDSAQLTKGTCVLVRGTVSHTGNLSLVCTDISCIQIVEGENKLPEKDVIKANKPLKRCESIDETENETKDENSAKKTHYDSTFDISMSENS